MCHSKLFIIGNGFDCAHDLPVRFNPDFKRIADRLEINGFWDIYQTKEEDIWSDFENLLAVPDFNSLENIFNDFLPDYYSDKEGDRDEICHQAEFSGNLYKALCEFANMAEREIKNTRPKYTFRKQFDAETCFITFNYTHTLEYLYSIDPEKILHIHGEVGADNLLLGYPEGMFAPETYFEDVRKKGRGPYREVDIIKYIDEIDDYYIRNAYEILYDKCKSFSKSPQLDKLAHFLNSVSTRDFINEVMVYGHSCAIDYEYFEYLVRFLPHAKWIFYIWDDKQARNVRKLIALYGIKNHLEIPIK
ncbi:MAG: hypothetical protein E7296_10475 [Lachnospiraceae bacterium]|jgi:hypothetical protein|nr:hypothetical protein [Lachnospiraceae bacterium]